MKKPLLILTVLPVALLVGCGEKEAIKADKEPVEIAKEQSQKPGTEEKLTVSDIGAFFTDERFLEDYKVELAKYGYEKPVKEILLEQSGALTKKGLVYEVEDGFAVLEYDAADEMVVATTGYENMEQIELQEMKTKAYILEGKLELAKDDAEKTQLEKDIAKMWEDIGKVEDSLLSD